MENVSKFKNNLVAKKGRVAISVALEYGLVFVTSLLLFYLSLLGTSHLPVYTKAVNKFDNVSLDAKHYVTGTKLRKYSDSGIETPIETDAKTYVATMVKTSAYIYGIDYPVKQEDNTYVTQPVKVENTFLSERENYTYDNISYFWFKYYPEHDEFNNKQSDITQSKIYLEKMGYGSKEGFVNNFVTNETEEYLPYKDILPIYLLLNRSNTVSMISKVGYNDTNASAEVNTLYNNLITAYQNGVQSGIDEVETNSTIYLGYMKDLDNAYNTIRLLIFLAYLVAYVVGYVILLFIGRGMAERFITVSQKCLNLALARKNEMEPGAVNLIVYHIINGFIYFSNIVIGLFFTGYFGALGLPLFGPFNLLSIVIVSLIFLATSFVTLLVTKNNQTLGLLVSNLVVKDTREFESNIIDNQEDGK